MTGIGRATIILGCALALAGCARGTPDLLVVPASDGPDEFSVLPTRPLEMPADMAALPAPTPGGANLADARPEADAVAALGGNAAATNRGGTDGALVAYATRNGVSPDIRSALATEDLAFRKANDGRVLERAFNVNLYYGAYESQSLDQHQELERFRRLGVATPAAPPPPAEE